MIFNFFRDIGDGIMNLIDYAPIIWKDRDWDQLFLYDLIAFKLRRMEREHKDWPYGTHKVDKKLTVAATCLERLEKDEYLTDEWEKYHQKYPVGKEYNKKESTIELKRLFKREEALRQQDLEMFAKIFVKHSRTWWT